MPDDTDPPPTDPKQRLLLAAEAVFAEKGYVGATVRDICDRAGMNVAAVNYHFGDKERLYVEAVKNAHSCTSGGEPLPDWPPDTPPKKKLADFLRLMLRQMHGPVRPTAHQLVMRELSNPTVAAPAVVDQFIRPVAFGLWDIVREIAPHLSEKEQLMIGLSIVGQCLFYRQNRTVSEMIFGRPRIDELDLDAVTEHVTRFTFAALGLGPAVGAAKGGKR